jgi:hypothetical protein
MNEKTADKIISVAYGDASLIDRISVGILIMQDKEALELYKEYKRTAAEVHDTASEEFPDSSLDKVYSETGVKKERRRGISFDVFSVFISRPLIASASVVLLAGLLVVTMFIKTREPEAVYSQKEIELAEAQTSQVFKVINDAFENAGRIVKENILKENVAKPMNESVEKISNIISKGEIK